MDDLLPAAEYWRRPGPVELFERNGDVLPFETDLLARAAAVASRTGPVQRVRVIGVGAGRELPAVRDIAPDAVIEASDISAPMIDACRRHVVRARLERVELSTAALEDLSPDAGRADLVVAINAVLCYLTTPRERERGVAALADLVRPGGTVAVVVQQRNGRADWAVFFALRGLATRVGLAPGATGDRRNHDGEAALLVHHYRPSELRALLLDVGFTDVEVVSLRAWGRRHGHRIRRRSPNPLLLTAVRRDGAVMG
ncbi:MAG: class I SAM-dependent methyltransferase [Microthrixaceae bacterium]